MQWQREVLSYHILRVPSHHTICRVSNYPTRFSKWSSSSSSWEHHVDSQEVLSRCRSLIASGLHNISRELLSRSWYLCSSVGVRVLVSKSTLELHTGLEHRRTIECDTDILKSYSSCNLLCFNKITVTLDSFDSTCQWWSILFLLLAFR